MKGNIKMVKKSHSDKEKELLEKIEKAKNDLLKLQEKQKIKIGNIACKFNLQELDKKTLENEFRDIAKKHNILK